MKVLRNRSNQYIVNGCETIWLASLMDIHFNETYPLLSIETQGSDDELVLVLSLADTKETWQTGIYNKSLISMNPDEIKEVRLRIQGGILAAGLDYQEVSIC